MAEKEKAKGSSDVLDLEVVQAFHNMHPSQQKCPVCGNDDWWLLHDEKGNVSAIPWATSKGEVKAFGLPLLTFFCNRCGFVRQHFLDAFKAYMKELRKDE